ncbi:MAG: hypothetical protein KF889_04890 [Alphaproteobacteria bacterium]|nr:hypothetical protein [Alphaproteobacteria bacterium]MCW5742205.1 hypothetical protein [Alphaproteobacteria bacterium]
MSSLDPVFATKFSDFVTTAQEQDQSKLRGRVLEMTNIGAETINFPFATSASSEDTYVRGADLALDPDAFSFKTATMIPTVAHRWLHTLDQAQSNVSGWDKVNSRQIANELNRKIDRRIIEAANAGASTGVASAALDMAYVAAVGVAMKTADLGAGKITWVVTPKVWGKLIQLAQITSGDYVKSGAIMTGDILGLFGMDIVVSTVLNGLSFQESTVHKTFVIHENALGLGIAQDVKTESNYVPQKLMHLFASTMVCGATVIDPAGVQVNTVSSL